MEIGGRRKKEGRGRSWIEEPLLKIDKCKLKNGGDMSVYRLVYDNGERVDVPDEYVKGVRIEGVLRMECAVEIGDDLEAETKGRGLNMKDLAGKIGRWWICPLRDCIVGYKGIAPFELHTMLQLSACNPSARWEEVKEE